MNFIDYLKQTKYSVLLLLSFIIEAVLLWQLGLGFSWLIVLALLLALQLIVGWWFDKPDDFSLFQIVTFALLSVGAVVLEIVQPSTSVRVLLGVILILGWFYIIVVKEQLTKNSDKPDQNEP